MEHKGRNTKIYQIILNEQEENIIDQLIKLFYTSKKQEMIIKSPSKRVSQLNLKFLDIRFLQVNENNLTTPLPRVSHVESTTSNCNKIYNQKGEEEQNYSCSIIKSPKQSILHEDNTADASINYHTSILQNNQKNDISTQNVLRYLGGDTNALYESMETKVLNNLTKKKQQKCSVYTAPNDSTQNKQLIKKYQDSIKSLQKQTALVHSQIVKMYAEELNKNVPLKSVSNLKLLKAIQNPKKSKNQNQSIDPRYRRKLDIFHSANQKGQKQKNVRDKVQKIRLPKLMKNKYENFYQDLYTQDRIIIDNPSQQSERNNLLRSLSEAKKKFISNSYDKTFQAYLIQKKMRVPQILQKLR